MNISWDAKGYANHFRFVPQYGEEVLGLIDAKTGSFVIDLGCGNGALTKKLAEKGFHVLGIDGAEEMTALAKKTYPELNFITADATQFELAEKADVIFSNAVFHWIDHQEALLHNIAQQLKPGGQLVFEFGGNGCAQRVHEALERSFQKRGLSYRRGFFFPTIGEYAPMLEAHGLRVVFATLFDRPTEQKNENGLEEWIRMFVREPFIGIAQSVQSEIIKEAVGDAKPDLYRDGKWYVDYVRIRMKCIKL